MRKPPPAQEIHEIIAESVRRARERGEAPPNYGITYLAAGLAIRLEDLRAEKGLTLQELADRVGTSKAYVSRLLSGRYSGLTLRTLTRHAAALGCAVEIKLRPLPALARKSGPGDRRRVKARA